MKIWDGSEKEVKMEIRKKRWSHWNNKAPRVFHWWAGKTQEVGIKVFFFLQRFLKNEWFESLTPDHVGKEPQSKWSTDWFIALKNDAKNECKRREISGEKLF